MAILHLSNSQLEKMGLGDRFLTNAKSSGIDYNSQCQPNDDFEQPGNPADFDNPLKSDGDAQYVRPGVR